MVLMASDEAGRLGADEFGPEHLLLAILSEPESTAALVLHFLGVPVGELESELRAALGSAGAKGPTSPRPSPDLKEALRMAVREAKQARHEVVGTEHLLLGLVHVGGRDVLGLRNLDLSRVREAIEDCGGAHAEHPAGGVGAYPVDRAPIPRAGTDDAPPLLAVHSLEADDSDPIVRQRLTDEVLPRLAVAIQAVESLDCEDADKHHALLELERTRATVLEIIAGIVEDDDAM